MKLRHFGIFTAFVVIILILMVLPARDTVLVHQAPLSPCHTSSQQKKRGANLIYDKRYYDYQRPMGVFGGKAKQWVFSGLLTPEMTVLEFGCGGGFILAGMRPTPRKRICVEINPHGRKDATAQGLEGVYETLASVESNSVDMVYTFSVLEHVECPVCQLREMHRVIRPGGTIIVGIRQEHEQISWSGDNNDPDHHLHTWNAKLLGNTMSVAGFRVTDVRTSYEAWPPGYQALWKRVSPQKFRQLELENGRKTNVVYVRGYGTK